MALASLATGVVGLALSILCFCLAGPLWAGLIGIVGLVLGLFSQRKIKASSGTIGGSGMALTGIITGAICVVLLVLYIVLIALSATPSFDSMTTS